MTLSLHPPAREPAAACAICEKLRAAERFADEHPPRDNSLVAFGRHNARRHQLARRAHALAVRFIAYAQKRRKQKKAAHVAAVVGYVLGVAYGAKLLPADAGEKLEKIDAAFNAEASQ